MVKILVSAGLMVLLMVGIAVPAYGIDLSPQPQLLQAQAADLDWTAEDLTNFANAYRSIQTIKQDAEAEMVDAVQAEGLTVEQFNTIVDTQLNDDGGESNAVSEAETAQFEAAVESIIAIRQTAEGEMQSAIEEEGISIEAFNQIIDQASQDPALQEKISAELNP